MTPRQKLELRRNDVVKRLNEIVALEGDDYSDEVRSEESGLKTELGTLHGRIETAILAEGEGESRAAAMFDDDGEGRERRELRSKVKVAHYVAAAMESRTATGAESEYNAAVGLAGNRFPLDLLAPEVRATTNAEANTRQAPWLDRLFADTAAMSLGVTFQSVAPGVSSHLVTTAGASAAQRGRSEPADDAAWTVGVTEIKPTGNRVRAVFNEEDAAKLPGLEEALRRDLSMVLTEGVDRAIFLGDSGANENAADIAGLTTATNVVEKTLTQTNKVLAPETLASFASLIDGKHASGMGDLRVIASVGTNTLWLSTIAKAAADTKTVAQFLRENGLTWGVRGEIETATAAADWGAFIGRGRNIEGAGVAAIWNSGMLIRDPYSGAAKGEVALTLSYLWGLAFPRPTSFARLKFVA